MVLKLDKIKIMNFRLKNEEEVFPVILHGKKKLLMIFSFSTRFCVDFLPVLGLKF